MNRQSDEQTDALAGQATRGNRDAFGRLYSRVAPALYAYACARLNWRHQDAEDVVAETWIRARDKFRDYDPSKSFRGWVHGFAYRIVKETQRRTARRLSRPGLDDGDSGPDLAALPGAATSVSRQVARNETLRDFVDWASQLSEYEQEVLILRGLQGWSHADVARALCRTETAVRERWHCLRAKIRNGWSELELLME